MHLTCYVHSSHGSRHLTTPAWELVQGPNIGTPRSMSAQSANLGKSRIPSCAIPADAASPQPELLNRPLASILVPLLRRVGRHAVLGCATCYLQAYSIQEVSTPSTSRFGITDFGSHRRSVRAARERHVRHECPQSSDPFPSPLASVFPVVGCL